MEITIQSLSVYIIDLFIIAGNSNSVFTFELFHNLTNHLEQRPVFFCF